MGIKGYEILDYAESVEKKVHTSAVNMGNKNSRLTHILEYFKTKTTTTKKKATATKTIRKNLNKQKPIQKAELPFLFFFAL